MQTCRLDPTAMCTQILNRIDVAAIRFCSRPDCIADRKQKAKVAQDEEAKQYYAYASSELAKIAALVNEGFSIAEALKKCGTSRYNFAAYAALTGDFIKTRGRWRMTGNPGSVSV
jgi:hypothetical protein